MGIVCLLVRLLVIASTHCVAQELILEWERHRVIAALAVLGVGRALAEYVHWAGLSLYATKDKLSMEVVV